MHHTGSGLSMSYVSYSQYDIHRGDSLMIVDVFYCAFGFTYVAHMFLV